MKNLLISLIRARIKELLILLVTCCFWGYRGFTQDLIVLDGPVEASIVLTPEVDVFWDASGKMTFEEVFEQREKLLWEKLHPEMPERLGPGKSWARFSVHNATDDRLYSLVRCFRLRRVMHQWINAYIQKNHKIEVQRAGRFRSYQHRASPAFRDCLLLEIGPGETQTYWIQLIYAYRHEPDMGFALMPERLMEDVNKEEIYEVLPTYLFSLFFLGVIAVLMIFAGIQYLDNRDKAYGWYFLYLLGLLVLSLRSIESQSHFDILYTYVLDSYYILVVPLTLFIYYAYLMFMEHFLHFSKYDPYQSKILKYARLVILAFVLLDVVIRINWGPGLSMLAFDLYQMPMFLLVLYYLYRAFQIQNRLAFYVILGSFFALAGSVINGLIMRLFDGYFVSSESIWLSATTYLRLGILLEILCFILGLSYKTRLSLKEKHSISQQLLKTQHKQELEAEKNRFYTNITHEFRTPLTVIDGMAQQIKNHPKIWLEEGLQMIRRNSAYLLNLVNQILDLRKLESGRMHVHMIQGDIIAYLKYLSESFESLADAQGIHLQFEAEPEELYIDYDPEKIRYILSNLLSNSLKFTPSGGEIQVLVTHANASQYSFPDSGPSLLIHVQDSGIGIPQEKQAHIFDRFYQVEEDHTRQAEGTGIGLALVQNLVNLLKGTISVESLPGMGTVFRVVLPITQEALLAGHVFNEKENPEGFMHRLPISVEAGMSNSNTAITDSRPLLLLIDDNPDVLRYLYSFLELSYRLVLTTDGQAGIDKALELIPDLIVSDVMMPIKDGFEVTQTLKDDPATSHIPIILLTAKADVESKLRGLKYGADAYLPKPFHQEELLIRSKKLLELRKKLRTHYLSLAGKGVKSPFTMASSDEQQENIFVLQVRAVVEKHLTDFDFSVEQLAAEINMSRSQLHRKLSALTNYSPTRLIRYIRLNKAKELLKDPDLSIGNIAFDSGFNDPVYFARVFKKEFGVTPTEFRADGL